MNKYFIDYSKNNKLISGLELLMFFTLLIVYIPIIIIISALAAYTDPQTGESLDDHVIDNPY